MSPLALSVVDEAQGNGEVVRMLVEHGADIDGRCWDVTPLMAACSGGHHWAIETLLELGADVNIRNGYEMMALDYCRDESTADIMYNVMRGFCLPTPEIVGEQEARRARRRQNMSSGMHGKSREPRSFQAVRGMPLGAAFEAFDIPEEWITGFKATGEHYSAIRCKWRRTVLDSHPDRRPASRPDEQVAADTATFTRAMAAFEVIEAYYMAHFVGVGSDASPVTLAASPGGRHGAVAVRREAAENAAAQNRCCPPIAAPNDDGGTHCIEPGSPAAAATARAARPLLLRQRVEVAGLRMKPHFNGRRGLVTAYDREAGRYAVQLDSGEGLKVCEKNMQLIASPSEDVVDVTT